MTEEEIPELYKRIDCKGICDICGEENFLVSYPAVDEERDVLFIFRCLKCTKSIEKLY